MLTTQSCWKGFLRTWPSPSRHSVNSTSKHGTNQCTQYTIPHFTVSLPSTSHPPHSLPLTVSLPSTSHPPHSLPPLTPGTHLTVSLLPSHSLSLQPSFFLKGLVFSTIHYIMLVEMFKIKFLVDLCLWSEGLHFDPCCSLQGDCPQPGHDVQWC